MSAPHLAKETGVDYLPGEKDVETGSEGTDDIAPAEDLLPEGGVQGWTTVAGAWLVMFATLGFVHAFGAFVPFYVTHYLPNYSTSTISWIGSFQLTAPYALGLVSGKLFDNGHSISLTSLEEPYSFSRKTFMLSLCKPHQYYQIFLAQGVGMGIGLGLTFVPAASVVVHFFRPAEGLCIGSSIEWRCSGFYGFPPHNQVITSLAARIGFAASVRAAGYLVLGTVVAGNALMRPKFPVTKRVEGFGVNMKSFVTDIPYVFTVLGSVIAAVGFFFPLIYIQLFATQHSVDKSLAFYAYIRACGRELLGRYLRTAQCTNTLHLMTGGMIWAMLGIDSPGSLVVVSVLYGLLSGAWLSLALACVTSLAKTPAEAGARTGLALAVVSIGSLISSPIQGALVGSHYRWIRGIGFSGSVVFGGAICLAVARILQAKRTGSARV